MEEERSGRHRAAALALDRLAGELRAIDGLDHSWDVRRDDVAELVDFVAARLASPTREVLAVLMGSTGAGKSSLLNALLGDDVSATGVKRPTTATPLVVTHPSRAAQHRIGGIGGIDGVTVVSRDLPLTEHVTFVDSPDPDSIAPGHASMARALAVAADLVIPVTTPARYADAIPWDLFARRWKAGIPSLPVMNRIRADRDGRMQVGHLVARAAMAGLPLETEEVLRIPERPGVGILPGDVAELVDVLEEVGSEDREAIIAYAREGALEDALVAAGRFVDDVERLEGERRRVRRLAEATWSAARTTLAEELARSPLGAGVHATVLLDLSDGASPASQADRLAHAAALDLAGRVELVDAEAAVRSAAGRAGAENDEALATLLLATGPEPPTWASEAFGAGAVEAFTHGLVEALEAPDSPPPPDVPPSLRGALLEARRVLS